MFPSVLPEKSLAALWVRWNNEMGLRYAFGQVLRHGRETHLRHLSCQLENQIAIGERRIDSCTADGATRQKKWHPKAGREEPSIFTPIQKRYCTMFAPRHEDPKRLDRLKSRRNCGHESNKWISLMSAFCENLTERSKVSSLPHHL